MVLVLSGDASSEEPAEEGPVDDVLRNDPEPVPAEHTEVVVPHRLYEVAYLVSREHSGGDDEAETAPNGLCGGHGPPDRPTLPGYGRSCRESRRVGGSGDSVVRPGGLPSRG